MLYFFAIERFKLSFKVNGKRQIKGENFSKKMMKNKIKIQKNKSYQKQFLLTKFA